MDLEQLDIQEAEQLENLFESSALRFNKLKHTYFKNFIKNNDYKKDLFYYLNIFNMIIYLGLSIVTYLQFYKKINFIKTQDIDYQFYLE